MYSVEADREVNLLRVSFSEKVTAADAVRFGSEFEDALERVGPGFSILTDLTGLEEMEFECAPTIRSCMAKAREHGVARVFRVIPDPSRDIGFAIMSIFHFGSDVSIRTFESRDEAVSALGGKPVSGRRKSSTG